MADKIAVRVTLPLRIRKGPGTSFGIIGALQPTGKVIEMDGVEEKQNLKGVSKWYYKLNAKNEKQWYWGGRLEEVTNKGPLAAPAVAAVTDYFNLSFMPGKMSWAHERFDIPFLWKDLQTAGRQITVAVVDTGIDLTHEDLKHSIHPKSTSFVAGDNNLNDQDGHGTMMAGMIGATGQHVVYGVAPQVKLLIAKGSTFRLAPDPKELANAIDHAATIADVDVVSISYTINDHPDIAKAVRACLAARKIVVAAIGNMGTSEALFPACYNTNKKNNIGVVAVGAFDQNGNRCSFSNFNEHLTLLAPGDLSVLTAVKGNLADVGCCTSIATAFTSGFIALMLSYQKKHLPKKMDCIDALVAGVDDIGPVVGFDVQHGFGRINLRNAISKIK
jgi:subtilisin family serine protease